MSDAKTCGRCGAYLHLHPLPHCQKPRRSYWFDRHYLNRHVRAWIWLRLSSKVRWRLVHRAARPDRDWCQLVDVAYAADTYREFRDDYECLCDVPLIRGVGPPRYGWCYCVPPHGQATPKDRTPR